MMADMTGDRMVDRTGAEAGAVGIRVAVPLVGGPDWMGGVVYLQNLVRANAALPKAERLDIRLVIFPHWRGFLPLFEPILPLVSSIIFCEMEILRLPMFDGLKVGYCPARERIFEHADIYFPLEANSGGDFFIDRPVAVWIPDLQHLHYPEFFTPEDVLHRNGVCRRIAELGRLLVFSSESACKDFDAHFPQSRVARRVLRFATRAPEQWFAPDPDQVRRKYGLPERYLLCCNQFWKHKDHGTLVRALALLKARGLEPVLACTGHPDDPRAPGYFAALRAEISALGLDAQVRILGLIDRVDQIQLVRGALCVVQPSLFEGWSTVVEDTRLLGQDMLLSDIDVHVEQAPPHGRYFRHGDPQSLADELLAMLPELSPGPDPQREERARQEAVQATEAFGRALKRTLEDALENVFTRQG